jgi:hypothetical protein
MNRGTLNRRGGVGNVVTKMKQPGEKFDCLLKPHLSKLATVKNIFRKQHASAHYHEYGIVYILVGGRLCRRGCLRFFL